MKRSNIDIDTGWAWVVLVVTYIGLFLNFMMHLMSGVFYIEFLNKFDGGVTKTSIVGALHVGLLTLAAPLGSIYTNRFSSRAAITTGGVLTSLGYIISIYVSDINWMILTYGIIIGLGFGLSTTGFLCSLGFYFDKWRDTVLSCSYIFMGISVIPPTPFAIYLIEQYGVSMTLSILACIGLQVCVLGTLCKPSCREQLQNDKQTFKTTQILHVEDNTLTEIKDAKVRKPRVFDIKLLKIKSFSCFLLSVTSWNFAFAVAIIHFPKYVSVLGGSSGDIKVQTTIFAVANVVGRLVGTVVVSKVNKYRLHVYVASIGLCGILTSLFILYSTSDVGVFVFTIQLGVFVGVPCAIMTPMALHFVGPERLPESHGLLLLFAGIGMSLGPIVIGYVFEQTDSYESSFIVAGVMLCVGALLGGCAVCLREKQIPSDDSTNITKHANGTAGVAKISRKENMDSHPCSSIHESTHL